MRVPHCLEYRAQWDVANYGERAAGAIEEAILREGPDTVGASFWSRSPPAAA